MVIENHMVEGPDPGNDHYETYYCGRCREPIDMAQEEHGAFEYECEGHTEWDVRCESCCIENVNGKQEKIKEFINNFHYVSDGLEACLEADCEV